MENKSHEKNKHRGLCADSSGRFVLRDGSFSDQNVGNLQNRFISITTVI